MQKTVMFSQPEGAEKESEVRIIRLYTNSKGTMVTKDSAPFLNRAARRKLCRPPRYANVHKRTKEAIKHFNELRPSGTKRINKPRISGKCLTGFLSTLTEKLRKILTSED